MTRKLKPLAATGKSQDHGDLAAGLYVLATPIGNAQDISLRALDVLRRCDLVAAEDTRVTSKLLAIYGIQKPLIVYNDHNGPQMRPKVVARLQRGEAIALVSDAGTPLISDPGYKLLRQAIGAGITVVAIPGPSAVLTALVLSGLPSDRFLFAGFLPPKAGERLNALEELKGLHATLIFFKSAQRLGETLQAMTNILGARTCAVARELTKLHEEVRRGSLRELAGYYGNSAAPKGEVTLLVGPPQEAVIDSVKVDQALRAALVFMPVKAAAEMVANLTDGSRKQLYERALKLKNDDRPPNERIL